MGFWFFLTVVVSGNMLLKAYKLRVLSNNNRGSDNRTMKIESQQKLILEKIERLEEAVFFDDFDLKRKFSKLEREMSTQQRG